MTYPQRVHVAEAPNTEALVKVDPKSLNEDREASEENT
jgi:hypothetical protein